MLRHAHFYMKGGLPTSAASARALGQSGESGRSMRGQIHKWHRRASLDAFIAYVNLGAPSSNVILDHTKAVHLRTSHVEIG
jgi:hypothetical protein